jgi:small subunit ribosomal protein S1
MREERKAKLIQELSQGEVRKGKVTGISSFGAFVDLGGADGLIHISELAWTPVSSPEEIVKVGDELDVYVLRVDPETKRIALSLKRLQQEPWETITERYQVGDVVSATVTKLTDFGAFARLEDSVEGLIHVSELTSRAINHPREVVKEGDPVRPKILRIEPERRRLGLSLRQAEAELAEAGLVETGQVEAEQAEAEQPEAGLVGTEQVEAEQAEEEQPVADQPEKKS